MFGNVELTEIAPHKKAGYIWHYNPRADAADGRIGLPIGIISKAPSPVAAFIGGTHGDEYIGPSFITDLFHSIPIDKIKGTLIFCPSASITGVASMNRFAPEDGINMNRAYPGDPSGSLTQRICYSIVRNVISKANLVFDIHSGGRSLEFLPYALIRLSGITSADKANIELAKAFGAKYTYVSKASPTHAANVSFMANKQGAPSIAMEISGGELVDIHAMNWVKERIFNALVKFNIIEGEFSQKSIEFYELNETINASKDGFYVPSVDLGDYVSSGDLAGNIYDVTNLNSKPVARSFNSAGLVVCRRAITPTKTGDSLIRTARKLNDLSHFTP